MIERDQKGRFAKGHKGFNPNAGKPLTAETKSKIRQSLKEHWKNKIHNRFGIKHTEETKEKMRRTAKLRYEEGKLDYFLENRCGKDNSFYGKHHKPEVKEKLRLANVGRKHTEATKAKLRQIQKNRLKDENYRKELVKRGRDWGFSQKGKILTEQNLKNILEGSQVKPNKAELRLNSILQEILPNEYTLNVRAEVLTLRGKIPDFVNINGQKKLIEFFGRYWHKSVDERKRKDAFGPLGWETLVIWEEELRDERKLKERILEFNYNG